MLQKIIGTTCDVINNLVGMQVYKNIKEEKPMRRTYSKDASIRVMAELIAKHINEVSDDDYEDMRLALDYKCSVSRLERLVDRITSKSREVSMDDIMRSNDEKQVFKELFEEVFFLVDVDRRDRRERRKGGISTSRNSRKPWLNDDLEDDYDNYGRDRTNRSKSNTGFETIADYMDEYMRKNNIPMPKTATAFSSLVKRAKHLSNDPDIISFRGNSKILYDLMLKDYKR